MWRGSQKEFIHSVWYLVALLRTAYVVHFAHGWCGVLFYLILASSAPARPEMGGPFADTYGRRLSVLLAYARASQ